LIFYELNTIEEKERHIRINNNIQRFLHRNKECIQEADLYHYVDYFLDKAHTGLWLSSSKAKLLNGHLVKDFYLQHHC